MKVVWTCPSFGISINEEPIKMGDMITTKMPTGILHEICLVDDLDMPDLEQ